MGLGVKGEIIKIVSKSSEQTKDRVGQFVPDALRVAGRMSP